MAETATVEQENSTGAVETQGRTFTQDEVNSIVENRLKKESAKYANYEELQAKASKFDEMEEASKSELQKAMEKANKLQAELDSLNKANDLRNLREKVSKDTGVPASLLTGSTEEDCMEQAYGILAFSNNNSYPSVKDGGEVTNTHHKKTEAELFEEWFNASMKN